MSPIEVDIRIASFSARRGDGACGAAIRPVGRAKRRLHRHLRIDVGITMRRSLRGECRAAAIELSRRRRAEG
jgi:hypothetical protein